MSRTKIDFGIDLGTTNSALAVMENGKVKIIKSHTPYMKDTTPSAVFYTRKKQGRVGDLALVEISKEASCTEGLQNGFIEFKRTMGTDKKYFSPHMDRAFSSEDLSAEILKGLKAYVTDDVVQAAVITVPNQFRQNQIDATQRAAEMAGLKCCELLQEPIAASMAFGVEKENMHGYWVVFDFGGGTFDAALMKVDEGVMKVVDTDGDNHLGGKDLDIAVVDEILMPFLKKEYSINGLLSDELAKSKLRNELKRYAEYIRVKLSSAEKFEEECADPLGEDDAGEEMDPMLSVTLQEFELVVTPLFKKAIDITKDLVARNNILTKDLASVLLVGGPTFSQTLRRMVREEYGDIVDTSVDPMTSVACGAALFASTKDIPTELQFRDAAKVQLSLKHPATTVETEESLGLRIDRAKTDEQIPDSVWVEVVRADGGWRSGKVEVTDVEIFDLHLVPGKTNSFEVKLTDEHGNPMPSEPSQFNIIQGLSVAKATLPHSICVDSLIAGTGKQRLVLLSGLNKNTSLPAKGVGTFKTQKAIRPGNSDDVLRIPLIEGKEGERAIYNQVAGFAKISGEHLSEYLPEGSEVEVSLAVDGSRRMTMSVYFPYIDETFTHEGFNDLDTEQREYDLEFLSQEIRKALHSLNMLETHSTEDLDEELTALEARLTAGGEDYDSKVYVFENLQKILKKIDALEEASEWPEIERELTEAFNRVKLTNEQYGNQESAAILAQLNAGLSAVKQSQNIKLAKDLLDQVNALGFSLIRNETGLWISYVKGFDEDFHSHEWSDPSAARGLINDAKRIISTQPSREKLEAIVIRLFGLLPDKAMPLSSESDRELLLS